MPSEAALLEVHFGSQGLLPLRAEDLPPGGGRRKQVRVVDNMGLGARGAGASALLSEALARAARASARGSAVAAVLQQQTQDSGSGVLPARCLALAVLVVAVHPSLLMNWTDQKAWWQVHDPSGRYFTAPAPTFKRLCSERGSHETRQTCIPT